MLSRVESCSWVPGPRAAISSRRSSARAADFTGPAVPGGATSCCWTAGLMGSLIPGRVWSCRGRDPRPRWDDRSPVRIHGPEFNPLTSDGRHPYGSASSQIRTQFTIQGVPQVIQVRYSTAPTSAETATTADLRDSYLVQELFVDGEVRATYTHEDRLLVGGAVPGTGQLDL